MKATTKIQKRVVELSANLPKITEKQIEYAYNNLFSSYFFQTKKEFTCFDCGEKWENTMSDSLKSCVCPHCDKQLKSLETKHQSFNICNYYSIITVCKEFQIVRNFTVTKKCKLNESADYGINEVVQNWIAPDGEVVNFALQVQGLSKFFDQWIYTSEMLVRAPHHRHNINPVKIYPNKRFSATVKRNGFKKSFYNLSPVTVFQYILTDRFAETLLKANQISMLKYYIKERSLDMKKYWGSICICIRNGYLIEDASMWKDYIDNLIFFGKDIQNAKFVCPLNLRAEHNLIIAKRKKQREIEERELNVKREKERILKHEENLRVFNEIKRKFFGIEFSDNLINVKVLESLEEYEEEGEKLFHCVFENEYYGKPETLILSARINGEPVETIELSLTNFEVLQCRGYDNEDSKYHFKIIELVNKNVNQIRKIALTQIAA